MTSSKQSRRRRRLSIQRCERRDLLTTVELLPVADNTLYEDSSGSLSNGAGEYFFAGTIAPRAGAAARRGLIRFDLSSVPANATINSVSLELNMSRSISGTQPVSLHTVLASWGEAGSDAPGEEGAGTVAQIGDATWFHQFFPSSTWDVPGGDFMRIASATTDVGGIGKYTWSSSLMVTNVQTWVSSPAANFGWIVVGNELLPTTAKRFDSRENSTAANRPKLIVDFDAPDTTSPQPTITGPASPVTSDPFDVSIDFGEPVTGFVAGDLAVGNGTVNDLIDDGGGRFTATIDASRNGMVTVDIPAGVASDAAGNLNTAATPLTVTVAANLDYGDAPTAAQSGFANSYPVTFVEDGARHLVGGLRLGSLIDIDADGTPTADASGDGSDDDGVSFVTSMVAGQTATSSSLSVSASGTGKLDAWVDFNQDGDWGDAGEQILTDANVIAGVNVLPIDIPAGALAGLTGARLRLSSSGGLTPTGEADDGEVEDYMATILADSSSPEVTVNMVRDVLTLAAESGDVLVRDGQVVRFRAPAESVGALSIVGTTGDDRITLDLGNGFDVPAGGLRLAGRGGTNTLVIAGPDQPLDLTDPGIDARDLGIIDLSSEDATTLTLNAGVVAVLAPATDLIEIVASEGDRIIVAEAADWRMTDPVIVDGQFHVTATYQEGSDERIQALVPHAWQNLLQPGDINNDGAVTVLDALVIINELGRRDFLPPTEPDLPDPIDVPIWPGLYFDQNGDDRASALDALRVINEIAAQSPDGETPQTELIRFLPSASERPEEPDWEAATLAAPESLSLPQPDFDLSGGPVRTIHRPIVVDSPQLDSSVEPLEPDQVDRLLTEVFSVIVQ